MNTFSVQVTTINNFTLYSKLLGLWYSFLKHLYNTKKIHIHFQLENNIQFQKFVYIIVHSVETWTYIEKYKLLVYKYLQM